MREALEAARRRPQSTNPTTFLSVVKLRKEDASAYGGIAFVARGFKSCGLQ
jgi:hypothetical protein